MNACEFCEHPVVIDPKFTQRHACAPDPACPWHYHGEPLHIGDVFYSAWVQVAPWGGGQPIVKIGKTQINNIRPDGTINLARGDGYGTPEQKLRNLTRSYDDAYNAVIVLAQREIDKLETQAQKLTDLLGEFVATKKVPV